MSDLHVVLVGGITSGFHAHSILPEDEAIATVEDLHGKAGDYVTSEPVKAPKETSALSADPSGKYLTVFGDIESGFEFIGPFSSEPEADEYGEMNTGEIDDHNVYSVMVANS
jgi:hypothetical protein